MSIGVSLTNEDLQAVNKLYKVRWTATISNWKERDTDYCMWQVRCPDRRNHWISEAGSSLEEVITTLLNRV